MSQQRGVLALLTSKVWTEISRESAKCKCPAHVAVAYFGQAGDRLLELRPGSEIVVDATISTISSGGTCPAALERLRQKGVNVYSAQALHAKVYAFDNVAFIGSANASSRSQMTLIEALVRTSTKRVVAQAREFVSSLCVTKLSRTDLAELAQYYRPPRQSPRREREQGRYSTLLMELTHEQGGGRETQVQPPIGVWESYFGLSRKRERLPVLSLFNKSVTPRAVQRRAVVKHHHNYTIELPGTDLPRPAILEMRRLGPNEYSYQVHRPKDATFRKLHNSLGTVLNPLQEPGRKWVVI
jgi:hypothetical protein